VTLSRLLVLLAAGLLSACAGTVRHESPVAAERVVQAALAQVGTPYRYGGLDPAGFDCSGLVHYSYARAGIAVPRSTTALWKATEKIKLGKLQPADLLFFRINGKPASHVGLYIGDGRFVHAPSSGKQVEVESLALPYWRERLTRSGRIAALWRP